MAENPENRDTLPGFLYALGAYLLWGFLPLYMKQLAEVPTLEVLAHRVLWSVPVALAILAFRGRAGDVLRALGNPRMLGMAGLTAALISVNWGIYVWSIQSGHAIEAALGYFINPLFSIFLGAILLGERLSRPQLVAIGLAAAGVLVLTVEAGQVPWVALGLTVTWGFYAYLKKRLPLGPNQGFALEVMILSPLALAFLIWAASQGEMRFVMGAPVSITVLLALAGVVTAVPLMLYANGAKLLRLTTIGILQYVSPTMIFLTAVFVFHEPFGGARAVAFPMIWAALAIYTGAALIRPRQPSA